MEKMVIGIDVANGSDMSYISEEMSALRFYQNILKTEYSEAFDKIRKDMMVMSFYKYGPLEENYKKERTLNAIGSLKLRLEAYEETGNIEFLADIANFAMVEFMHPQHKNCHYKPTDSGSCKVDGFGVNEIKRFTEDCGNDI